jgi:hypothetical protein
MRARPVVGNPDEMSEDHSSRDAERFCAFANRHLISQPISTEGEALRSAPIRRRWALDNERGAVSYVG